jgi:hypothetical protein
MATRVIHFCSDAVIKRAYEHCNRNVKRTAKLLGLPVHVIKKVTNG